jgi:glycosyltransferase involved in cell wall biosynthesis
LHADLLFSLTNYLPDRRVRVPTLLLVQHAGHFSAEFRRLVLQHSDHWLSRLAWLAKTQWVRRSVSSATRVTVQTAALAHEIAVETGRALSTIDVVPHGLGLTRLGSAHAVREQGPWRIGYITKYGVQKNFYVLFQAMAILRGSGREMKLVLTLDPGTREFPELRAAMERAGIADQVENHGEIAQDRIEALYDSLDLFVFPSICESFGFPMVEAMARGLPLIASDTPGNREVAGTAGIFFRSDDSAVLAEKIVALCDEPERYRRFTALSIRRAADFSWEQAAVGVSRSIELALAAGG